MESILNFERFEKKKKNEPYSLSISEIIDSERRGWLLKCIKGPVSENPLAVNVLKNFTWSILEYLDPFLLISPFFSKTYVSTLFM